MITVLPEIMIAIISVNTMPVLSVNNVNNSNSVFK